MICQVPFSPNMQKQVMIYLFSNHVQCASHQQELALSGALCEPLGGWEGEPSLQGRWRVCLLSKVTLCHTKP